MACCGGVVQRLPGPLMAGPHMGLGLENCSSSRSGADDSRYRTLVSLWPGCSGCHVFHERRADSLAGRTRTVGVVLEAVADLVGNRACDWPVCSAHRGGILVITPRQPMS